VRLRFGVAVNLLQIVAQDAEGNRPEHFVGFHHGRSQALDGHHAVA
jgi:hypothetical protein